MHLNQQIDALDQTNLSLFHFHHRYKVNWHFSFHHLHFMQQKHQRCLLSFVCLSQIASSCESAVRYCVTRFCTRMDVYIPSSEHAFKSHEHFPELIRQQTFILYYASCAIAVTQHDRQIRDDVLHHLPRATCLPQSQLVKHRLCQQQVFT